MTFQDALSTTTSSCETLADKIRRVKVLLDATETALFNWVGGGGVTKYKVNTGQSVIEVEANNQSTLMKQYRDLFALYNELCNIAGGGNVMVMRDASTLRR